MRDLISRQAAIKAIHDEFDECLVWDESGECTANEVERVLDGLPTTDAVPVVRCRDCKYGPVYEGMYFKNGECEFGWNGDDFFCAYGERRKE